MLGRMGFGFKWISWMKCCVESGSVSVLVNGSPTEEFLMSKGLRQGDPLAPFLFLIVAEGLGGLMKKAVALRLFKGFLVGRKNVEVSHLQFADDTLSIGDGTPQNILTMKAVLRWFELISGLKVNFYKSKLVGVSLCEAVVDGFARILHCKMMNIPFVYLRIPVGANPRTMWSANSRRGCPLGRGSICRLAAAFAW